MQITLTGYYGQQITAEAEGNIWETIQSLYRESCPSWHDATLVGVSRDDKGCAYAAPGTFTVTDIEGLSFTVILA